ncbi:MAG: OmpH family outer membrane protein [Bacteroidales bacterium]|nr:OmpH family outer membrane protein [Bacteroidales bacterium]MDY3783271.1 OmpH family outer membrane protein [Candidatus Cryptobacteroides sp.]
MKKFFVFATMALAGITAFAQPKFAHVNLNELVQLMPEMDEARTAMNASSKEANETYMAMVEEFNSKAQAYQQKASSWTPAIRESKEKELNEIQGRIQEFQESIQAELQQQQQQLMAPIYKKASDTVNAIAKEAGYIFVFEVSQLIYVDAQQSTDITPQAREKLGIPADRTLESLQAELQAQAQNSAIGAQN